MNVIEPLLSSNCEVPVADWRQRQSPGACLDLSTRPSSHSEPSASKGLSAQWRKHTDISNVFDSLECPPKTQLYLPSSPEAAVQQPVQQWL